MENEIDRLIVYISSHNPPSSIVHSATPPLSPYSQLSSCMFARLHRISSALTLIPISIPIHISLDIPATTKGRENPRPKPNSQPRAQHAASSKANIPMNPQYLKPKYLVRGLKGKLFLGPSG